jgi:hypothetical protein
MTKGEIVEQIVVIDVKGLISCKYSNISIS